VSIIAGKYFTDYPTTFKGLSLSIIYSTMLMYFVFGAILSIKSRNLNLQLVIRVVSIILITIVLIEYFNQGFANFLKYYYDVFDDIIQSNDPNKFRLIGTLRNSNNLGLMSIILLYLNLFNKGNWIFKAIVAVGFVIIIFLSGSRTAFVLLLFVGTYYLANIWTLRNVVVLVLIVAVMVIAVNSFFDIYSTVLFRRIENTELKYMFYTRQTYYWEDAIKIILEVPITGIGRLGTEKFTVDNFYLNLTRTNGIVGLLLWIAFLYQTISLSVRYYFTSTNAKILLGTAIIVLTSSITADFYYSRFFYPLFMIIFGYYSYELLQEKNYFNKPKYKRT
jgi:O-antigen ligase